MLHFQNNQNFDTLLGSSLGALFSLAGIISGFIPDVETISHTIVLSIIGAGAGFLTSYLLKKILKK